MTASAGTVKAGLSARPSFLAALDPPRRLTMIAAGSMVLVVGLLLLFVAWNGIRLFLFDGQNPSVLVNPTWLPAEGAGEAGEWGLLPFIAGTVAVTAVAILIATPLAIGLALFLSEVAPGWARRIVQPSLEMFVGIPSVVYGWIGLTVLVPWLRTNLGWLGFDTGFSWFAGSLVLTVMILPTITSVSYDALRAVPDDWRTASLALGTTRWQTIRHLLLPASVTSLATAVVLGMTRAAGEALAVQMVIGSAPVLPTSLTTPMSTLTSQITVDMGNTTFGSTWNDALWTMSLILLVISVSFVVLVRRLQGKRRWQ
jgi:phosphate transport system permease protein